MAYREPLNPNAVNHYFAQAAADLDKIGERAGPDKAAEVLEKVGTRVGQTNFSLSQMNNMQASKAARVSTEIRHALNELTPDTAY